MIQSQDSTIESRIQLLNLMIKLLNLGFNDSV